MAEPSLTLIRASAGSGKTWRLTEEYIGKLFAIRNDGDNDALAAQAGGILAVTFTNAAANEMRGRVIKRLKEAALGADQKAAAAAFRWLDIFLRDLGALNIRTIDSLLHQIVRASALDLEISPDFNVDFDVENALKPHVELILEQARGGGPGRELIRKACYAVLNNKNSKSGFTGYGKILRPLEDVLKDTLLGKFKGLASAEDIEKLRARITADSDAATERFLDLVVSAALSWKDKRHKTAIEKYLQEGPHVDIGAPPNKRNAAELFKDDVIPPEVEEAYSNFKTCAQKRYIEGEILDRGLKLKPFIELSSLVAEEFTKSQSEHGIALQDMLPAWAASVLASSRGVSESLCRMGSRLTHYLVDEFQDTSNDQWQVLQPLALEAVSRGGSLTCVGDIKQSIYGWRGGDPGLFEKPVTDSQLTAIVANPRVEPLESNWRSQKEIVEHNNKFFSPLKDEIYTAEIAQKILGKDAPQEVQEDLSLRLRDAFADVEQKCQSKDSEPGFVAAEEVEGADGINERICQLLLDDIGMRRPWSDVLILVRKNELARDLAALLGERHIPAITENGLLLKENTLIIQIIAFLEFLDNPGNEVAFWTMINGEIFATHPIASTLPDLVGWAAGREPKKSLYRQFETDFPEVWQALVAPFLYSGSLMTAYDAIQEWYRRMDVERRFSKDATMLRRLLETAHLAENSAGSSIAAFLSYWQKNSDKEKAPMPEKMDAVRIMTIHKAKGLEAPVVIVAGADYHYKVSDDPVVMQVENVSVAANYVKKMGPIWYPEIMRQSLETLNLLYVAFTRPREELYLLLRPKVKEPSLRGIIRSLIEKAGWSLPYSLGTKKAAPQGHRLELMSPASPGPAPKSTHTVDNWRPMSWLPRLKIYHTELTSPTLTAKQRGVVLHSCLEFMNFAGDPEAAAQSAFKSGLSACSIAVPDSERPGLLKALTWYASAVPARDWLARGWREQPLVDADGQRLRADMIVPEPWGPLVIDYKSGEPHPEDVDQIRAYMKVLAQSGHFPGQPCGLLIYLDKQAFRKVGISGINLIKHIPGEQSGFPNTLFTSVLPPLP